MKVKNIMFSGFAAAVLAGACGAADAATYTLASKDYVTNQLATKQNTLTAGEGIDITDDTISADLSTVTVEGADGTQVPVSDALTDLTQSVAGVQESIGDLGTNDDGSAKTVADALEEKQDTLTADQQAAVDSGITAEDVAEIESTASAVDSLAGTVGDAESGLVKDVADLKTDITTKADAQALTEGLALKEDVANKIASATAEQIEALSTEEKEAKYPSVSVAQTIANAAVTKVNEVAGDLSTLQTQVGTNTADITQLKTDVAGKADTSDIPTDYVTDSEFETYQGTVTTALDGKQATIENLATIESGAAAGATALQPNANISELNNDSGYQTAQNVSDTIAAGHYLTSTDLAAGTYLVSSDGQNNVSYTSVAVIDGEGNELVLTPAAN
ncbi:MAG: hypothetical protein IJ500_03580 [Alphaproteobacteria bacterium]|nr:hypothetical protein [Alphaproteobacteria bacterium]